MDVLVVDDSRTTLAFLGKKLEEWGHSVYLAPDGKEAWKIIISSPVEIIISDWLMPKMDGLELCRQVRNTDFGRYLYFILLTARDKKSDLISGLKAGADDYISKPVDLEELRVRLEIAARVIRLEQKLNQKYNEIKKNYFQTIRMFINLIEIFDEEIGGHCRRVARLCLRIAKWKPEFPEKEYQNLEIAGLLHDVGMIGLPREILTKRKTEMNGEEIQLYRSHPVWGESILREIEFLRPVAKMVRSHHEQYNGRGFPDGLRGDELTIGVKILSAASIYDNLIYRGKVKLEDVPDHLYRFRGYQLDPEIADILLEINRENLEEETKKKYLAVALEDLKEGMVIARAVRRSNGALLIPQDTELTGYTIEKLKAYHRVGGIENKVLVYK
ncbi:MAG: hypothetical protein DRG25_06040 [Deltaproteobacteria bacterium]|nr:MAG: hypothetical protein DRG25_06040 [Deltaproteobacteria bacterium]